MIGLQSRRIVLATALLSSGCWMLGQRAHDFDSVGVYEAPRSGLVMIVRGTGRVESGADTSDHSIGTMLICARTGAELARLDLGSQHEEVVSYRVGTEKVTAKWDFRVAPATLRAVLEQSGHSTFDDVELAQLVGVFGGVMAGPKATTLAGQSSHLLVRSVEFGVESDRRLACSQAQRPSPSP